MSDTFDELIRNTIGVYRDAAPTPSPLPRPPNPTHIDVHDRGNRQRTRQPIVRFAAIVVTLTVVLVIAVRSRHDSPTVDSVTPATAATPSPPTQLPTSTTIAVPPPATVTPAPATTAQAAWRQTTGLSDAGMTAVGSVGAGPNGFVAVGYADATSGGLTRSAWFSPNGTDWAPLPTAPFTGLEILNVTATSTAYYIYAHQEGVEPPQQPDLHVLRSTDATVWTEIDAVPLHGLLAVGDRFMTLTNGQLMTSIDASVWTQATINGLTLQADSTLQDVASTPGRLYATVTIPTPTSTGAHIIESTDDGTTWTLLPDPPQFGQLVAVNDTLVLIAQHDIINCLGAVTTTTTATATQCTASLDIVQLHAEDSSWKEVTNTGIPPVAAMGRPLTEGNVINLPTITRDGALTLFESNDAGTTWTIETSTPFALAPLAGFYPTLIVAHRANTTILLASSQPFHPTLTESIRTQ